MKKSILSAALFLIIFFMMPPVVSEGSEVKKIVGFEDIAEEDRFIYPGEKLSEGELEQYMPEYLNVYLEGEEGVNKVSVHWKSAVTDYDNTDYYCYQFSPVFNEAEYILADGLDIYTDAPYIFVCFGEQVTDSSILSRASQTQDKNAAKIMSYLTNTIGLSTTAACGVVANIYYESGCRADIIEIGYTWDNGGGYGICQWTNYPRTAATGRRTSLVTFCRERGYNYKSLDGQLKYLQYELTTDYYSVLNSLKDINVSSNPKKDVYDAAYIWCTKFEIPHDAENAAVIRGNFAKTLWKEYQEGRVKTSAPKLTSYAYPESLAQGRGYPVTGKIESSPTKLTKVKVSLVNTMGKTVCSKSAAPGTKSYNVAKLDAYIRFDKLTQGLYYYKITATNQKGTFVLLNKDFVVTGSKPSVTGITQTSKSATSVTISWKKMAGVTGYKIMRSASPDGTYKEIATVKGASKVKYKDAKIPKRKQYYYKVRAYTKTGKTIRYSAYSRILPARTSAYSPAKYKKVKVNTGLYSEAGTSYSYLSTIKKGTKIRLLNYSEDKKKKRWYYIQYGTKYGYIRADKV